jgi:ferredoxin-NADP reductase
MAARGIPLAGFRTRWSSRNSVAEGTMAFYFVRRMGFSFKAGQAADITLLNPPETDSEGNIRTFSIASPPLRRATHVCTRMRDTAFKRSLKVVPLGTEIQIAPPSGSFTLHKNANKPAVFLAGGIGPLRVTGRHCE